MMMGASQGDPRMSMSLGSGGQSAPVRSSQPAPVTVAEPLFDTELLKDRSKAFEAFRRTYRKNESIEENKALLKTKYDEANALGESGRKSKTKISEQTPVWCAG